MKKIKHKLIEILGGVTLESYLKDVESIHHLNKINVDEINFRYNHLETTNNTKIKSLEARYDRLQAQHRSLAKIYDHNKWCIKNGMPVTKLELNDEGNLIEAG